MIQVNSTYYFSIFLSRASRPLLFLILFNSKCEFRSSTLFYCAVLCCTALYCTVFFFTLLYLTLLHSTQLNSTLLLSTTTDALPYSLFPCITILLISLYNHTPYFPTIFCSYDVVPEAPAVSALKNSDVVHDRRRAKALKVLYCHLLYRC